MVIYEIICREVPFEEEEPADVGKYTVAGVRPDLQAVPPECPMELVQLMQVALKTGEVVGTCLVPSFG